MSIVFDRAVDFYDDTRALPPELARRPIETLVRETGLHTGAPVLELGVGTGRIAIPLARVIGKITGVDLSLPMMQVLERKLGGETLRIDLVRANIVQLPFPDNTFELVYGVHVLHLVQGWEEAIVEARRVLKPGGRLAITWHRRSADSPNSLLRQELHRLVQSYSLSTKRPGAQSEDEILAELEKWGGEVRTITAMDWTELTTPGQILDDLDRQIFSETWMIPRAILDSIMPGLRAWAKEWFGSLDKEVNSPYNFRWLIARK